MGICHSNPKETDFCALQNIFLLARDTAPRRIFDVIIPSRYENVCDDVVSFFQIKGWIIKYKRYRTYSVTLPSKKEVVFSQVNDVSIIRECDLNT